MGDIEEEAIGEADGDELGEFEGEALTDPKGEVVGVSVSQRSKLTGRLLM